MPTTPHFNRTAYRRLHGGSTAPALVEHAKVRTLAMDPADRGLEERAALDTRYNMI